VHESDCGRKADKGSELIKPISKARLDHAQAAVFGGLPKHEGDADPAESEGLGQNWMSHHRLPRKDWMAIRLSAARQFAFR